MLLAEAIDPRWELTVDGEARVPAHRFRLGHGLGPRRLRRRSRSATGRRRSRYVLVLVQILLGVLALVLIRTWRHGPPFGRYLARRRVAASPATTVIDLTAEPPDRAPQAVLERNGRAP